MSELGLPSALVISTPFQTLARITSKNLGHPDHPVLVLEHPIWTRDQEWIDAQVGKLIDPLLKLIGGRN